MNKKAIIVMLVIILIVVLAVLTGMNLGKGNSQQTTTTPTSEPTAKSTESPIPTEEPTESPEPTEPTEEPTASPEPSVNVSKMNTQQKIEYAKSMAKQTWEKLGVDTQVYYSYDDIDGNGNYLISVREESTTKELVQYKININTNTCETIY